MNLQDFRQIKKNNQNYKWRRVVTANNREMARIIRDCHEQLYDNKSDHLKKYTFLRLDQKEVKSAQTKNAWEN